MMFKDGGVTAPRGFLASGVHCGIREGTAKKDLALVLSERDAVCAGVFTQNRVKAECVKLSIERVAHGHARAVIANSGIANACTGEEGRRNAENTAAICADALGIDDEDVIVYSTGVIGLELPMERIKEGIPPLCRALSKDGHIGAREAIMTTDTHFKECAVQFELEGRLVTIGAMAKGSGMIHINLGTMLCVITTDCAISREMLDKALRASVAGTFNCVSIDGDTSTNDSLVILANGMAENPAITEEGEDYDAFLSALNALNTQMARKIAGDGEGATRLIECNVTGARDVATARGLAKAVISSSLLKAAVFGADANFGRILCAMGYSGYDFDPDKTTITLESAEGSVRPGATDFMGEQIGALRSVKVYENGVPLPFDEELAKKVLSEAEIKIEVECRDGNSSGTAWGCDLTYDYVKINGDYRS